MVREHLFHKKMGADPNFRWRGGEVSRAEAIADGVFAITVTLLIVANSSTQRFYDVWVLARDIPAFFISFAMIMYAWFEHYLFFRRYGLADGMTLFLNFVFLFLIMALAYPLKLLTTFLWYLIIGEPTQSLFTLPADTQIMITEFQQRAYMMYFYGAAIVGVFATLLLMHLNALRQSTQLELDQLERLTTLKSVCHHSATVLIAVASLLVLNFSQQPGMSGIVYFLMPIAHFAIGYGFTWKIEQAKANTA